MAGSTFLSPAPPPVINADLGGVSAATRHDRLMTHSGRSLILFVSLRVPQGGGTRPRRWRRREERRARDYREVRSGGRDRETEDEQLLGQGRGTGRDRERERRREGKTGRAAWIR